jgi:hypothetical protein
MASTAVSTDFAGLDVADEISFRPSADNDNKLCSWYFIHLRRMIDAFQLTAHDMPNDVQTNATT